MIGWVARLSALDGAIVWRLARSSMSFFWGGGGLNRLPYYSSLFLMSMATHTVWQPRCVRLFEAQAIVKGVKSAICRIRRRFPYVLIFTSRFGGYCILRCFPLHYLIIYIYIYQIYLTTASLPHYKKIRLVPNRDIYS